MIEEIKETIKDRIYLGEDITKDWKGEMKDLCLLSVYTKKVPVLDIRCEYPNKYIYLWLNMEMEEEDDDRPGMTLRFEDKTPEERLNIIATMVAEFIKRAGDCLIY